MDGVSRQTGCNKPTVEKCDHETDRLPHSASNAEHPCRCLCTWISRIDNTKAKGDAEQAQHDLHCKRRNDSCQNALP